MKNIIRISSYFILAFLLIPFNSLQAERNKEELGKKAASGQKAAGCVPASGSSYLSVNNVRVYIETSGTMWNDKNRNAQYIVPKEGSASSMYAAALWIGGKDIAGQLKLAAIRFRQVGDDFWPGPLTLRTASIEEATCRMYDKHFFMSKKMAFAHKERQGVDPDYTMPEEIRNWPGNPIDGNTQQSWYIAPYMDVDGDGSYTPEGGDYPYYDFANDLCPWTEQNRLRAARGDLPSTYETEAGISFGGILADQVLKGDETLWWIFNDKGNAHTESRGAPIGLEIRAQVFGFTTTDELNNMTFYSYEIINRSSFSLEETYFSQWVDADLGYAQDDYVGCDVERGLGYCYNGTAVDGTGLPVHYGKNPPAIGVDFFQGPYLDADGYDNPSYRGDNYHGPSFEANYDNVCEIVTQQGNMMNFKWDSLVTRNHNGEEIVDTFHIERPVKVLAEAINGVNFGDGIVDNERFGMRRFVYHNNDNSNSGDPSIAVDYYNYLRGIWKDNSPMRYGGTGYHPTDNIRPICDFMFPGMSDPCDWGTKGVRPTDKDWTEKGEGNAPQDRRFMQSAGPFTLEAGAINYITVGIPWARATSGEPYASVQLLKLADDKAQTLFENCFVTLEGPDAPDLAFREMDKQIIVYITNSKSSNNYKEEYRETDPTIPSFRIETNPVPDTIYRDITAILQDINGNDSIVIVGKDTIETFKMVQDTFPKNGMYDRDFVFEGYQIYQLVNQYVSQAELSDPAKAQIIYQCDIKNGITQIINYEYNAVVATEVPVQKVDGANAGIKHSFVITEDKFPGEAPTSALINHRKYYYMAVAYAYNNYESYNTSADNPSLYGQKTPYLLGNKNVQLYTAIPHSPYMEEQGIVTQSDYETMPQIIQLEGQGNGGFPVRLEDKTIQEILANNKADSLIFQKNYGPIGVKVVDPLKVVGADFTLRFYNPDSSIGAVTKETRWRLEFVDPNTDTITIVESEQPISILNEQFLLDFGISITIHDARFSPVADFVNSDFLHAYRLFSTVDFLTSSVTYTNPARPWLTGVPDIDGGQLNWIRGGTTKNGDWKMNGGAHGPRWQKYNQLRSEDYYFRFSASSNVLPDYILGWDAATMSSSIDGLWLDKDKKFSQIAGGFWAPYALASIYDNAPGFGYETRESEIDGELYPDDPETRPVYGSEGLIMYNMMGAAPPFMTELYSVDIVLTSDKSKWTRCPVIEMSDDPATAIGGARRHDLRKSPSVDINGKQDPAGGTGMGWFPGYAICIETGERMNMMFGENSSLPKHNGTDMLFNPTSTIGDALGNVVGGGHYIYVMGHRDLYRKNISTNLSDTMPTMLRCPYYQAPSDGAGGNWLYQKFLDLESSPNRGVDKHRIYKNVLWTAIPIANSAYTWLEEGNDVTFSIRVSRPYQRWSSATGIGVQAPKNNNLPLYKFSTKELAVVKNQHQVLEKYLDSIYITPNPYYGMSGYENSQLDTRVKIINIPGRCDIKIYTMDGTLIRTLKKDDPSTFIEWDLKNSANIPIASGMYLIHIRVEDKKEGYNYEKTLKFLCIQRPTDVNAF